MEIESYKLQNKIESSHWWYLCRRNMLKKYLEEFSLNKDALIFDGGVSTGTNLRLLQEMQFSNGIGLDYSKEAIDLCRHKNLGKLVQGDLTNIPFADESFDFVLATDVFEHIDRDDLAMAECFRVLKKGSSAIFMVPTFQCIWGLQDEVSHHKRRYLKASIFKLVKSGGFEIEEIYYYNYIMFFPIWLGRMVIRLFDIKLESEAEVNTYWINQLMIRLFTLDIACSRYIKVPFGVSAFIKAKKC